MLVEGWGFFNLFDGDAEPEGKRNQDRVEVKDRADALSFTIPPGHSQADGL